MLLSVKEEPFNSEDYLFEFKWDGFRSLLFKDDNEIYLQSRNSNNLTPYFSELKEIHKLIPKKHVILDGEICYFSSEQKQDFSVLQKRLRSKKKSVKKKYKTTYIVWDILEVNDTSLYSLPLQERKEYLKDTIQQENYLLQISPYILHKGKELYSIASDKGMEGIVAKKTDSPYVFARSDYWYKIKIWHYKEVVIGGYSKNKDFLLVGLNNRSHEPLQSSADLKYMGKVKILLDRAEYKALFNFLPTLKTEHNPFDERINTHTKNTEWVSPGINVKVRYTEITNKNHFRHGYAVKLLLDD